MKKLLLSAFSLFASFSFCNAQTQNKQELAAYIFSELQAHTERATVYGEEKPIVIHQPDLFLDNDLLVVSSNDVHFNLLLKDVRRATVERYGVVLTGPDNELNLYMPLSDAELREKLQNALDAYISEANTKYYTVRE